MAVMSIARIAMSGFADTTTASAAGTVTKVGQADSPVGEIKRQAKPPVLPLKPGDEPQAAIVGHPSAVMKEAGPQLSLDLFHRP